MISLTTQYALRAMLCLAKLAPEEQMSAQDLAERTGVSPRYLSAVLRRLVSVGLLSGARGRGGGYRLARPANRIRIVDLAATFEDIPDRMACPFGLERCHDDQDCPIHAYWKPICAAYIGFMRDFSLADVVEARQKIPSATRSPRTRPTQLRKRGSPSRRKATPSQSRAK